MVEGALLGITYLVLTWALSTQWKEIPTLYLSLSLTVVAWLPSLIYANKMVHHAGYFILPALIILIVSKKLAIPRGEIHT